MRSVFWRAAFVVAVSSILMLGCASWFWENEVEVKGVARLSDNPSTGHAGIVVSTNTKSTTSAKDGSFSLVGLILNGTTHLELIFSKPGYETTHKQVDIDYTAGTTGGNNAPDQVVDVGTVTLRKL